jgi:hypothetical protein
MRYQIVRMRRCSLGWTDTPPPPLDVALFSRLYSAIRNVNLHLNAMILWMLIGDGTLAGERIVGRLRGIRASKHDWDDLQDLRPINVCPKAQSSVERDCQSQPRGMEHASDIFSFRSLLAPGINPSSSVSISTVSDLEFGRLKLTQNVIQCLRAGARARGRAADL